jgi:hypothetical protein
MLTLSPLASLVVGLVSLARPTAAPAPSSVGDSIDVPVAFSATGGSVTPGGLYTAGAIAGSYRVIVSSRGIADTAIVTLSAPVRVQAMRSADPVGIPFGAAQLLSSGASTTPLGMSMDGYTPAILPAKLAEARSKRIRVLMNLTGGAHWNYLTGGSFDITKWEGTMGRYNTSDIKALVAAAVADGTILGASVMDEPNAHGLGDGNTWGPSGTMTKARVDSMCGYVKAMFPTLPVGVAHQHGAFEPNKSYRVCDFIIDQYSSRAGEVTPFRDEGLALAKRDGHAIIFSMNVLNGGIQAARHGGWDCPVPETGGRGNREPNCRMTAQQVRDYGLVLGPAGCGLMMWRYDADFMSNPENRQAFNDIAARLATLPAKPCRRR